MTSDRVIQGIHHSLEEKFDQRDDDGEVSSSSTTQCSTPVEDLPATSMSEQNHGNGLLKAYVSRPVLSPASRTSTTSTMHDETLAATAHTMTTATTRRSVRADEAADATTSATTTTTLSNVGPPYSMYTLNQKRFIVLMASWAGFFSPASANIYLPALNALATDLNVSNTLINLTLTSYMIFQGLAPAFIGNLADSMGRRPAYFICFFIYIAANIGLALQDSYAALFVLRCLQSTGSSATIAMSSAVVSDVSTPAERGTYMGFALAGSLLGPAIAPVLGGILTEFLGWRSIFWFLVILSGVFVVIFAVFFPETARHIVGNGSIAPKGLNMSLMNYLALRKARRVQTQIESEEKSVGEHPPDQESAFNVEPTIDKSKLRFPNPLSSLKILLDKANALLLLYNAFMFAAFYDISAILPSQLSATYRFNDLQIGLCYIPIGTGAMAAALVNGVILDRNFRRWCTRLNVTIKKGRDQDLSDFPIEKVRLQIAMPAVYLASCLILAFGWVLDKQGPLAAVLVILFFASFCLSIAFNVTSTLLVDFYPRKPATATAANNLVRCLLGAGATGVIIPMVEGMGLGWCFTFISFFLIATSPMLWILIWKGAVWRQQRKVKETEAQQEIENRKAGVQEEGKVGEMTATDVCPSVAATVPSTVSRSTPVTKPAADNATASPATSLSSTTPQGRALKS